MPFSTGVGVRIAFVNTKFFTANQDVGRVKSIVDDFFMEQGTASMRVAFVLRSAEVQPLFRDLCDAAPVLLSSNITRQRVAASFPPFSVHNYYLVRDAKSRQA